MATKFTRKEIENRTTKNDAVLIIDNLVYNVTEFLDDHPGGEEILLKNAGQDASQCFRDVSHSEEAREWRKKFMIGEVVDNDKWEVVTPQTVLWVGDDDVTWSAALSVWGPPMVLAVCATLIYCYML